MLSTLFGTIFALSMLDFSGASADPDSGCTPYQYPPVFEALDLFPSVGKGATILPNDTKALAKWESIRPTVPDISPKIWRHTRS